MPEYPILQQNKPIGTLRVTREGLHTVFSARAKTDAPRLRLAVCGARSRAYLGLMLFAADEAWDIPAEPEPAPEPAPQCADDGLDVLWYSAPDGVLTTFDGKRTVIAIPADAPNLPRGAQAVLREIDGRPYLIFPR